MKKIKLKTEELEYFRLHKSLKKMVMHISKEMDAAETTGWKLISKLYKLNPGEGDGLGAYIIIENEELVLPNITEEEDF